MKLWHIVAVVGVGVAFGFVEPGRLTNALSPVTLYVLLPALLFEAAWNLNYQAIRRQWPAIATLAGPGVVLTILIVAGVLACARVPLGPAFLTGAILSATDPIAVVAVFRRIRVPKTLSTIIECESLFNDGVAVTAYQIVLAFLAIGRFDATAVGRVTAQSTAGVIGGLLLGVAIAFAAARALRGRSNPMLQIAATAAVAYGAYFAAVALSLAGVFATIAAGIAFSLLRAQMDRRLHCQRSRNVLEPLGADCKHRGVLSRRGSIANGRIDARASVHSRDHRGSGALAFRRRGPTASRWLSASMVLSYSRCRLARCPLPGTRALAAVVALPSSEHYRRDVRSSAVHSHG